jgi:hypothetical protein
MSRGDGDRATRRDLLRALLSFGAVACTRPASPPFACTDTSDLPAADAQTRATLAYAEPAPNPTRRCGECQQYVAPPDGQGCGSCKVVKGPVHPNGTCKAFAPKLM